MNHTQIHLGIFCQGLGSNVQNIFEYFKEHAHIVITEVFCVKAYDEVAEFAGRYGAKVHLVNSRLLQEETWWSKTTHNSNLQGIILSGFLQKIPSWLVSKFPRHILNLHPALLPQYGGKGMYGRHVFEAIIAHSEQTSGITIHLVNDQYDEGNTIFQTAIGLEGLESVEDLIEKIKPLEHRYYPRVIEMYFLRKHHDLHENNRNTVRI